MASLDSVRLKHQRAKDHFEEYSREIAAFFDSDTGELALQPESTGQQHKYTFGPTTAIPPKLALIARDCIQCLRTCLDYLVWELVAVAGHQPGRSNMFPITLSEHDFNNAVTKQRRLAGVDPGAIALIENVQPYRLSPNDVNRSPLAVLEELTNINKHRRMILTSFNSATFQDAPMFPARSIAFSMGPSPEQMEVAGRIGYFIAIQDGAWAGMEVSSLLNAVNAHIGRDILAKFRPLFP